MTKLKRNSKGKGTIIFGGWVNIALRGE